MHPVQQWIPRFIGRCVNVGDQEARQIWQTITQWIETHGGLQHQMALRAYPPAILLPVGHILVLGWPGRDCIVGFSRLARSYGLSSLPYVRAFLGGVDYELIEILLRSREEYMLPQIRFLALWMAAETVEDMFNEFADQLSSAAVEVNRTVKLANYLLGQESTWWRRNPSADAVEMALRAIARRYV